MKLPVSANKLEAQPQQQPASPPQQAESDGIAACQTALLNLLRFVAFTLLAINAVDSAYRSRHDPSALAFVAFAYSDLVLLFVCLKRLEKLGPDSSPDLKERLKAAVWVLAAALNIAFAWRVAEIMPPILAVVVWVVTGFVVLGGFYGMFIYRDTNEDDAAAPVYSVVHNRELSPEENV